MNRSPSQGIQYRAASFDTQAGEFDQRAGLPEDCCASIAQAIVQIAGLTAADLLVEIGCGTGQIGAALIRLPLRYLGFDLSEPMLQVFRHRIGIQVPSQDPSLIQADADQEWPVAAGSARALFSSRAIHLLDPEAVIREVIRVAHPEGAVVLIGRVQRDPDSPKAQLQAQMQQLMRSGGWHPRQGRRVKETLLDRLGEQRAERIEPRGVARWWVEFAPIHSLDHWRGKPGLGGVADLPEVEKQQILGELTDWARDRWGADLQKTTISEETYELQGIRLLAHP